MNLSYFTVLMILSACGKSESTVRSVDPLLEPHVKSFEAFLGHPISYSVQLGNIYSKESRTVGECESDGQDYRNVVIDAAYAKSASPVALELLVYHELGHCSLNLDHNTIIAVVNPSVNKVPVSIMNPYTFSQEAEVSYLYNRDQYIKELFRF